MNTVVYIDEQRMPRSYCRNAHSDPDIHCSHIKSEPFIPRCISYVLQFQAYAQTFIADDRFLALVGSFSSVFNCAGRPLWGIFMDKFRYKVRLCSIFLC